MAELGRDLIPFAQDQHAAQVLVERMFRLLRRSQAHIADWEGPNSGTGSRVPIAAHDGTSAGMAAAKVPTPVPGAVVAPMQHAPSQPVAVWHGGSDPAGSPWAGGSQISGEAWRAVQGTDPSAAAAYDSRPFVRQQVGLPGQQPPPHVTAQVQAPRRTVPIALLVVVFALATALGVVVAIMLTSDKPSESAASAGSSEQVVAPPQQPPAPPQPQQAPAPQQQAVVPVTPPAPAAGSAADTATGSDLGLIDPSLGQHHTNGGTHPTHPQQTHQQQTHQQQTHQQQTTTNTAKQTPNTTTPNTTTTTTTPTTIPGEPRCWDGTLVETHMHGCPPQPPKSP
jgi:hypothetical protein